MSVLEDIVKAVAARFKSQGVKVKTTRLVSDWGLAEKYFDRFLKGLVLMGLNEFPGGSGNLLLFAAQQNPEETIAHVEVGGSWVWSGFSISALILDDHKPFASQAHSALISETNSHV